MDGAHLRPVIGTLGREERLHRSTSIQMRMMLGVPGLTEDWVDSVLAKGPPFGVAPAQPARPDIFWLFLAEGLHGIHACGATSWNVAR